MALTAPTLAVADLATGLGATATLTGGDAGATNTLYSAPVTGGLGSATWTNRGSRTGAGTISVALTTMGYYWWRVESTLVAETVQSNLVYQNLTDGVAALHSRCQTGAVARLQGMTFSGLPAAQIYAQSWPDDKAIRYPCLLVTLEGEIAEEQGGTNERDERSFPVRVLIANRDADANDATLRARYLKWREQITRAFCSQRLAGCVEVIDCHIVPQVVFDPRVMQYQYVVSGLVLKFIGRQQRGLT